MATERERERERVGDKKNKTERVISDAVNRTNYHDRVIPYILLTVLSLLLLLLLLFGLGQASMKLFAKSKAAMMGGNSSTTPFTGKKPTFGILLDSPVVASGAMVSGRVWADIPSALKGTRMHVDFIGKEATKVQYTVSDSYTDGNGNRQTRTRHEHAYSTRDIFRIALPVAAQLKFTETGKIAPGQYVMPFSAVLPAFLPSNMEIKAKGGYAKISYKLKMALKGSGVFWDYTAEAPVYITSASIGTTIPTDTLHTIKHCVTSRIRSLSFCPSFFSSSKKSCCLLFHVSLKLPQF